MKKKGQNLLPKKVYRREARNYKRSKISLRVPKRVRWLTISFPRVTLIVLIVLFFSGYHPVLGFPPVKSSQVLAQTNVQNDEIITASFPKPVVLPHPGYLSTRFSAYHPGIDIATGLGMPIHPITAGWVEQIDYGFWGYGNHVTILHVNGFKSMYAHMGRVFVRKDQAVTSDDVLGEVGLTGYTTGPHTHLEISFKGKNIDPLTILPEIPPLPQSQYLTTR